MSARGVKVLNKAIYIVAAKRTPCGAFGGSLKGMSATQLAAISAKDAIQAAGVDPKAIDSVVYGNVNALNSLSAPFTLVLFLCFIVQLSLTTSSGSADKRGRRIPSSPCRTYGRRGACNARSRP